MVPIFWQSKRQTIVSTSVAEAELIAECDAFIAQKGMSELVAELRGFRPFKILAVDNAAAEAITQGTAGPTPWRTRHLKSKSAALTEAQDQEEITISHVPGVYQCADLATKTLPVVVLKRLMMLLVLLSIPQVTQSTPAGAGGSKQLWLFSGAMAVANAQREPRQWTRL